MPHVSVPMIVEIIFDNIPSYIYDQKKLKKEKEKEKKEKEERAITTRMVVKDKAPIES